MIDPDGLNVWCGQELIGYLWRNQQGQIGFNYESRWLDSPESFALSVTLPLWDGEYKPEDGLAHRFFANLLPEGGARDQIVRDLKISDNDFDLLRAIGGECAGALSVLRAEEAPRTEHQYHQLSDEELENLVRRKGQPVTWKGNDRPRLSLAGAQNKCPVLVRSGAYWLPQRESPSSHIIKFEINDYRHLPAYETFTTLLGRAIELPVVDISLQRINKSYFALVRRYDREEDEHGHIARYHQEDFCQALGFGHQKKYQQDGGPTFKDCYRLVADISTDPAEDLDRLLRWQIFNVLAGNSDGHAKNISWLYLPGGEIRIAPFYDLICTRAIERIDDSLAFSVGGERNPSLVTLDHWKALAKDCGVTPRYIQGLVNESANGLLSVLQGARKVFEDTYGEYRPLERIEQVVTTQCRRALK
jgi:serine/threonine-protein kinase HipA